MIKQEHKTYPKLSGIDGNVIKVNTLVDLLSLRSKQQADELAYTFLLDGEKGALHYSYSELDKQARSIAATLQDMKLEGERAVLLFPQGLNYIAAFFGCLYAGVIGIPAYPPKSRRHLPRLQAILDDSQAAVILSTEAVAESSKTLCLDKENRHPTTWLLTDKLHFDNSDGWQPPKLNQDSLAFLQYTSGSTGNPKGVMVSHGNLMANQKIMQESANHDSQSTFVGWLPFYHDMGLICNIMQPLYIGAPAILMSPMAFLEKPLRWLKAISDYRAHTSGGPNFAYDLCVKKISHQEKAQLDLSTWQVAFNGAEPINPETLDRFEQAFVGCGFRRKSFYPCYGLAEATVFVSGTGKSLMPTVKSFNKSKLEEGVATIVAQMNDYRRLVSCGIPGAGHEIRIVDPNTQAFCDAGHIGEIQVSGPSLTQGYWQNATETAATFVTESNGEKTTIWLRTGDLGFIENNELYISGRLKDLIIIRGRNYYPQDIESTAELAVSCLNAGALAAFSINRDDGEKLVLLAELKRSYLRQDNYRDDFSAIRSRLVEEIGVQAEAIVLLKPGTILKTTSGKIRRLACKESFEKGFLDVVAHDYVSQDIALLSPNNTKEIRKNHFEVIGSKAHNQPELTLLRQALLLSSQRDSNHLLAQYLCAKVAALSGLAQDQIDLSMPVLNLGVDSLKAVELKYVIDDLLHIDLPLVLLLEDKSLSNIAEYSLRLARQQIDICQVKENVAKTQRPNEMPLSHGQQSIWTVCQVESDSSIYSVPIALEIHSEIDPEALRAALRVLLSRHEQLRMGFRLNETMQPVQVALQEEKLLCEQVFCGEDQERHHQISIAVKQPFDLENGPLLRTSLFSTAKDDHILLFCAHHIIVDFHSMAVMLDEVKKIYTAIMDEQEVHLQPLAANYFDYICWQQNYLKNEQAEQAWQYWKEQLAGEIPKLELPLDRLRTRSPSYLGRLETLTIDLVTTQKLKALAKQNETTLYVVLLSIFKVLLHRYSGQQDIIVGSPVACRPKSEFADLIGYFVNPVALRSQPVSDKTFIEYLAEVRQTVLSALKYQNYPFPLLVEKLQPVREEGGWPFYQVMFVLQESGNTDPDTVALALGVSSTKINWPGMEIKSVVLEDGIAQFDLTLTMAEAHTGLLASIQYSAELFEGETIRRMLGHFQNVLQGVVHDPSMRLFDLPLLTGNEHRQRTEWNATQSDYPHDLCIHQLIEAQAQLTPDAVAVTYEGQSLSYGGLNQKANRLAHHLVALGIRPDDRVAICMERSLDMVVGLLGALKAGGAYVPLDPGYPTERLAHMLKDSAPVAILSQAALQDSLAGLTSIIPVVLLDAEVGTGPNFGRYPAHNPDPKALGLKPGHLAYVIYTSGSTGLPKGVAIAHANTVNFITWAKANFTHELLANTLFSTSINFDLAVFEVFVPLSSGALICLVKDVLASGDGLEGITLVNTVPSAINALVNMKKIPESVQSINLAGEQLKQDLVQRLFASTNVETIANLYGPSETTTYSTWVRMTRAEGFLAHIGRPIANTQIYILDAHLQPVPIGVTGEIYIGGAGVSRGYLGRPGLTAERFLPNPFASQAGSRLYKTGDTARYLADGNIEFLGRNDFQVKIRGFRIELGEVEAQLGNCPGVREAVVIAREDSPGDKRLVAYLLAQDNTELSAADLRRQLATVLAEHQLPSAYVTLESFPLTPNGKLDRKALPMPEYKITQEHEFVAPRDEAEEAVAKIWCEVLGICRVSIYDNFFDLGGHSLSAVQVIGRTKESFGISVSVKILFESPTIAGFVDKLSEVEPE